MILTLAATSDRTADGVFLVSWMTVIITVSLLLTFLWERYRGRK